MSTASESRDSRAFNGWARHLATIAGGAAMVSAALWGLARPYFCTRAEYDEQKIQMVKVSGQVDQLQRMLESQTIDIRSISNAVADIRVKLAETSQRASSR